MTKPSIKITTNSTKEPNSYAGLANNLENLDAKERKRHQNRVAQRTYRKNQKKRVQALELAVACSARGSIGSSGVQDANLISSECLDQRHVWDCANGEILQLGETVVPMEPMNQFWSEPSWEHIPTATTTNISPPSLSPCQSPSSDPSPGSGRSALHRAASNGSEAMCRVLLEGGADMSKHDNDGKTALHIAVEGGSTELVKLMLENRNPNVKDSLARTALFQAVDCRNEAMIQLLLDSAVDVNSRDDLGEVVLHVAVESGLEGIVQMLLKHGADVNA